MSLDVTINLNSLRMIEEELANTIALAATEFEAFVANQEDSGHLEASVAALSQVNGTFRLLQFPGAAMLAAEMAALGQAILDGLAKLSDNLLKTFANNLFVLPRYIEYVGSRQSELPTLLIPYINELRVLHRQPMIAECYFYDGEISFQPLPSFGQADFNAGPLLSAISRLRHMYQLGLLAQLRDSNSGLQQSQMMLRALERSCSLIKNHPDAACWTLATAFVAAIADGSLELTFNRKRSLAEIEKLMRKIATSGEKGIEPFDQALSKDLLFALMLSGSEDERVQDVRLSYSLPELPVRDVELAVEREKMYGPSADTLASVIKVLKEELRHTKEILELASQNNAIEQEDHSALIDGVGRVADTLGILNLSGPMESLRGQLNIMQGWGEGAKNVDVADFLAAADVVLFVESSLSGLDRRDITVDELNDANALTRKKIIANSHLAEAERIVLEEAQSGIALAKRAITSYVDSNFDITHISNVAVTLNTVRGGLHVLNYDRAARILSCCGAFIESHVNDKNASDQRHQLLETLADALISMEYYLGEVATSRDVNDAILDVAEESLAALGFKV